MSLTPRHTKELTASALDPKLAQLNCRSYEPGEDAIYERFFRGADIDAITDRVRPDAQWGQIRKRWGHLGKGALAFVGLDPDTQWQSSMDWARFKPNSPRQDWGKPEKFVKYECRPGDKTRVMYFRVTLAVWRAVSVRYNVPMPSDIVFTPDGEAIGFWPWVAANPSIPVIMTEGEKKALCLLSHGYAAVSIPGIWNGVRKVGDGYGLHPDLMLLANSEREFVILFDFETKIKTQWAVFKATLRLGGCIDRAGANARVACLPGPEKGIDDWLVALRAKTQNDRVQKNLDRLIDGALSLKEYGVTRVPGGKRGLKKFKPDVTVDTRYLSGAVELPESGLVGLRSDMGTGKTELLARWRKAHPDERFLNNGHRIALLRNLSGRLGTAMYSGMSQSQLASAKALSITIDSLHKLAYQLERYDCIFIDEATQYLVHLLRSKTCKEHRRDIIEILTYFVRQARLVVLADAHLDDLTVEFFARMRPEGEKPFIIENQWKSGGRDIVWYEGPDESMLVESIAAHIRNGGYPMVVLNSKRSLLKIERRLKEEFPTARLKAIHSGNSGSEENIEYVVHINKSVLETDALLASPSLGTGVDIKTERFTAIFGLFRATSATATDCVQQLWRYRLPVPMHIWVAERPSFGYQDESFDRIKSRVIGNATTANRLVGMDNIRRKLNRETGVWEYEDEWLIDTCVRLEVDRNRSINNLRLDLKNLLEEMGNRIVTRIDGQNQKENALLKAAGIAIDEEHCRAVASAEEIDPRTAAVLERKDYLTPEEVHQLERYRIESSYGMPITEALVELDDGGRLIGKLIALEGLLEAPTQSEDGRMLPPVLVAERDRTERAKTDIVWDWRNHSTQWGARIGLGLREILARLIAGDEFSQHSPEMHELKRKALENRHQVKQTLGLTVSINAKPMRLLSDLLAQVGLATICDRKGGRGNEVRNYRLDPDKWAFTTEVLTHRKMQRDAARRRREEREADFRQFEAGLQSQYGIQPVATTPSVTIATGEVAATENEWILPKQRTATIDQESQSVEKETQQVKKENQQVEIRPIPEFPHSEDGAIARYLWELNEDYQSDLLSADEFEREAQSLWDNAPALVRDALEWLDPPTRWMVSHGIPALMFGDDKTRRISLQGASRSGAVE